MHLDVLQLAMCGFKFEDGQCGMVSSNGQRLRHIFFVHAKVP